MGLGPFELHACDLAPGDRAVLDASWDDFSVESVRRASDPAFDEAFGRLWREFGPRGEMERREVVEDRLRWDPVQPIGGYAFLYELVVVRAKGHIVAVRDHTAIVSPKARAEWPGSAAIVHLSHVLVEPELRGSGLASWLRALPIDTARRCCAMVRSTELKPRSTVVKPQSAGLEERGAGLDPRSANPGLRSGERQNEVTLVAEMEHDDGRTPAIVARLRSYAKAGFRVADPSRVPYSQPDFREAAEIDRTGVQPVSLCLVLRRVGHESDATMPGSELREVITALRAMFGVHVRADHLASVRALDARLPTDNERVDLLVPGAQPSEDHK